MTTVAPVDQRATVKARYDESVFDRDHVPAGEWHFYSAGDVDRAGILFGCPCGCGQLHSVQIRGGAGNDRPSWEWNGLEGEAITLSPSILIYQMAKGTGERIGEHWHGFLTDGVFRSC